MTEMKDRIRQLMESKHMTQQVFATYIGMSPASLSSVFNDRTKPTLNLIDALKKKFPNLNTDWLVYGTGPMFGHVVSDNDSSDSSFSSTPHSNSTAGQPSSANSGTLFADDQPLLFDPLDTDSQQTPQQQSTQALQQRPTQTLQQRPTQAFQQRTAQSPLRAANINNVSRQSLGQQMQDDRQSPTMQIRAERKVTEIRVFYDDQTWESFMPSKK